MRRHGLHCVRQLHVRRSTGLRSVSNGDTRPYNIPQTDPTKVYYVTISEIEPGLRLRIETAF
ncbi:MAG: hypothetical protein KF819_30665 [Labilithrix sp.]|nr:hypothetical protein [Labilithrix sp.]